MRSTFSVRYYLKRTVVNSSGRHPIMGRITINGTIAQFCCKLNASEGLWDVKGNCACGKGVESRSINYELDNIRSQIRKHYQYICD